MNEVNFSVNQEALAVVQNTVIDANFDECKQALEAMMRPYATLVVTEDDIPSAKSDLAKIRKVANRVDEMRKAVKKAYNGPLTVFEGRCKELVSVCGESISNLDGQIKSFDAAKAEEKLARLREYYGGLSDYGDAKDFCPWDAVRNEKWRNKTYEEETAKGEIAAALLKTQEDLAAIRSMENDVPYLLDYYREIRDLGAVLRKAEVFRKRREAEAQRLAEQQKAKPAPKPEERKLEAKAESGGGEAINVVDFRVWATKVQLNELKAFLKEHGIRYGRVPMANE